MIVLKMNQMEPDFWSLMGPFFASAKVKRELGIAMSSDESYSWFLAMEQGKVLGFCAIVGDKIRHLYVIEAERNKGIGGRLIKKACGKSTKTATVSSQCLSLWQRCGFAQTGVQRGRYVEVSNG